MLDFSRSSQPRGPSDTIAADSPPAGTLSERQSSITHLLAQMEQWGASDLYVNIGQKPALRINGRICPLDGPETPGEVFERFREELLTERQRAVYDAHGDLDVGYSVSSGARFRINLLRQRGQAGLVARALPTGDLDLAALGLPDNVAAFAGLPRGLVLVTGATGSGKSTTLAALLHRVNTSREAHIVTIEDPIEFVHRDIRSRVTQREIGSDSDSFQQALKHVVRQSPDVIMIGEMRDAETMRVALSAALTGHLVLATLHTIDTSQTLQRILSYFSDDARAQAAVDLSLALAGIVSQRLVPQAGGQGRVVAVEVLTVTPVAQKLIREQRIDDLTDWMRRNDDPGIQTFNDSLLGLLKQGRIDLETGLAYATSPDEFSLAAKGMTTGVAGFRQGPGADAAVGMDMQTLLAEGRRRGASDIHITSGRPPIYRVNGQLVALGIPALSRSDMRLLLYSVLSARQRQLLELEREIDFALQTNQGDRYRVNAYYQKGRLACALRMVATSIPTPKDLRLPPVLLQLGARPHGLLLVVGPTGSGKSTTLACLVDQINRTRACRILTVEDPIEYVHGSIKATIDQRELHDDTKGFPEALRHVLRQDPDVILIGEMRDLDTISSALTAAETGHLVLSTLHTNDAASTIDRIVDVFPSHQQSQVRSQLASSLVGIVSQRLLPTADCKGRVAAFEVLVATTAVRSLIREGKTHQILGMMETAAKDGMMTLDSSLRELLHAKRIDLETAMIHALNPKLVGTAPASRGIF